MSKRPSGTSPRACSSSPAFSVRPLADYNVPLPFFDSANAPLWHRAIGYEIAGIVGILL